MKLLQMELENFRQYMGVQRIDFASTDKNITIIFGENGKGKTGIFRALMFCLYGSRHIQQDNSDEVIHLVNLKLLDQQPNTLIKASVKMVFEHRGQRYELYRSIKGRKSGNRIDERIDSVKLVEIDEMGNYDPTPIDEESKVKSKMNDILHEEIKDFFLFDAEKIDTLAKTDAKVKKEVKAAIFKLLQIDNLEEAKLVLDGLYSSENNAAISNAGDLNIGAKNKEIESVKEKIEKDQASLEELNNELQGSNELINKYEIQLSQNEDIKVIQDKVKNLQDKLSLHTSRLNDLKTQAQEFINNDVAFLLLNNSFQNVSNYLDQIIAQRGNFVSINVIDQSLQQKVCACCNNDLSVHNENLAYVQALKDNYKSSELSSMSASIKNMIVDRSNRFTENELKITNVLRKVYEVERERKGVMRDIEDTKKEIGAKAETQLNLDKIKQALEKEQENLTEIRAKIVLTNKTIEESENQLVKLERELKDMLRDHENLKFDSRVLEVIDSLKSDIKEITREFSTSMRHKLRDLTTEIFKKLIDKKDVNLISSININEKFELEIIGGEGVEITQDISQGQRQIVSLSFITALAQVASGDGMTITFPLFMDSPFNRISGVNRDQLISNIPNLTSQWILLLTDTELTVSEERVFKSEGRLGKWYRINQIEPLNAQIEEVSLSEALTTRGL